MDPPEGTPGVRSADPAGPRARKSANLTGTAVIASWMASLSLHAVLFAALLLVVFPFSRPPRETSLPFADVDFVGSVAAPWSPVPAPQPAPPIEREVVQPQHIPAEPPAELPELTRTRKPELSILGIGAGGGDFADLGLSIGSGPGAAPQFFGLGGSARGVGAVVYVVDVSGSMIDTFVYVRDELRRSISALRRSQKFHVIFFSSGPWIENPPQKLVSAIEAQKERFFTFLDQIRPRGGTDPRAAMHRAIELKPDLIYLLSDGIDFPDDLLENLERWNTDQRVRIFTIAYLSEMGRDVLEQIARRHRGEFRFVSESDLP